MFYVEWQPCAICGASIDTIAGNPDRWATYFFINGSISVAHMGCVSKLVREFLAKKITK